MYARCLRQFEKATRNTLLWRVPGQRDASKGRNNRMTEMIDFFPTVIDLVGVPKIPQCTGVDQPPTVLCLRYPSNQSMFKTLKSGGTKPQTESSRTFRGIEGFVS